MVPHHPRHHVRHLAQAALAEIQDGRRDRKSLGHQQVHQGPDEFGAAGHGEFPEVDGAVRALSDALPGSGDGAEGTRRAFASGALAEPDSERRLARTLAEALWPEGLTAQIRQVSERAGRPLVRIQPSPRVAQVPWELLAVDDGDVRLIDLADVVTTAPASLRPRNPSTAATQSTDADTNSVVLVLDPRAPGFRADSPLGSVLGPPGSDPELLSLVRSHLDAGAVVPSVATPADAFRRTDLDRDWLSGALRKGARRLLYVGHVSGAPVEGGQSEHGMLHLSCDAETVDLAEPLRTHRPLSAKDLLRGTLPLRADGEPGARIWPAPARVALIGCESGGDLRFAESFGPATAMLHNRADLVTATPLGAADQLRVLSAGSIAGTYACCRRRSSPSTRRTSTRTPCTGSAAGSASSSTAGAPTAASSTRPCCGRR